MMGPDHEEDTPEKTDNQPGHEWGQAALLTGVPEQHDTHDTSSHGVTVGGSVANLSALFPQGPLTVTQEGEKESAIKEDLIHKRKRSEELGDVMEIVPMPPPPKKSAATSAEQKRNREKQRRSELNETLDDLSELVFQIDPSLRSGRAEVVGMEDRRVLSTGRKNTITNRTELIQCTVRLLKRIHSENQQKDQIIGELGHPQLSTQQRGQQGAVNPGTGMAAPTTAATNIHVGPAAGTTTPDFAGLLDQSRGPQSGYPHMMRQMGSLPQNAMGHQHFGNGGAALPGLMFPAALQGLLSGSGFQGAANHIMFDSAMGQQPQQPGHPPQFSTPAGSLGPPHVMRQYATDSTQGAQLGHLQPASVPPAPDPARSGLEEEDEDYE